MAMCYVKLFYDWERFISPLPDAEAGKLLKALLAWASRQELQPLQGSAAGIFQVLQTYLDRDRQTYSLYADAEKGKGGGTGEEKEKEKYDEKNEDEADAKERGSERAREAPRTANLPGRTAANTPGTPRLRPDPAQIASRVAALGLEVDPRAFYDYYAARDWMLGSTPMADLDAALRSWSRRAFESPRTVSAHRYTQRRYAEADLGTADGSLMREALLEDDD